ncbi:hypothetical protein [Marinicrinis lubricantis]|uniref:Uncharacterized protein n=1 Tax=Marinicrinis lubricantis TaxID=2086470 RepID=A0ABW1IPY6_9BACL
MNQKRSHPSSAGSTRPKSLNTDFIDRTAEMILKPAAKSDEPEKN